MRNGAGRVLGFALVAVLVMSVLGLAASQTFINKTGKTVSGIKIEFSRKVLIIRHDFVFPDQSPRGRSDEFTFSGKNLRNLGRFSITWSPSFGKVIDYEWIEVAQPVKEQPVPTKQSNTKQEFVLPDPNTPPILYGDDYPGPDEPLYQPKPDEQIWLTDLEGHGDIYDNDSIKINYAPGFDVSQITSIDVYRNGIRLRFLPKKFDVLTNAQMKTFDGNPAEHSPASAHTDHAIMGYEYKFEIHTADDLWIMTKTVKSGFRWRPKEVWAELQGNWMGEMGSIQYSQLVDYLKILKSDGFTGVSVEINYYMDSPYDNEVKILPHIDTSIISWYGFTPSNFDLETILKAINEAGLDSQVLIMTNISQSYVNTHSFVYQADIDPKNPNLFFENYTNTLDAIIPLLNKFGVASLIVLEETDTLYIQYPHLIRKMLSDLHNVFHGRLGIDFSTNLIVKIIYDIPFRQIIDNMTFLGWKSNDGEYLNVKASFWEFVAETQKDQRVSYIQAKFANLWKPLSNYFHSKHPESPLSIGEIGSFDIDGYVLGVNYFSSIPDTKKRPDEQERTDFMCAVLEASKELGIVSLDVWSFLLCDLDPNWEFGWGMNIGYKLPEGPEYRVIKAIIKPRGD